MTVFEVSTYQMLTEIYDKLVFAVVENKYYTLFEKPKRISAEVAL